MFQLIGIIVVAFISLIGTLKSSQIQKNTELVNYRLEVLEKKIDKQDALENDIIVLKEQIKVANNRIKDLERGCNG